MLAFISQEMQLLGIEEAAGLTVAKASSSQVSETAHGVGEFCCLRIKVGWDQGIGG